MKEDDEVFDNNDAPDFDATELPFGEDEEFVIDEWDLEEEEGTSGEVDTLSELTPEVAEGGAADPDFADGTGDMEVVLMEEDEHDMLFGNDLTEVPENVLGENRTFTEDGSGEDLAWAGEGTDLEDLGMEMVDSGPKGPMHMAPDDDDGLFDIDSADDLILIDADGGMAVDLDQFGLDEELDVVADIDLDEIDEIAQIVESDTPAHAEESFFEEGATEAAEIEYGSDLSEEDFEIDFEEEDEDAFESEPERITYDVAPGDQSEVESADGLSGESFETTFADFAETVEEGLAEPQLADAGLVDAEFEDFAGDLGADLDVTTDVPIGHEGDDLYEPGIDYNTRDFENDEEDSEWAPVSEFDNDEDEEGAEYDDEEYDEAYEGDEEGSDEFDEDAEPDYSEHEEAYYENTHDFSEYADEPRARSYRWVAGLAAAMLLSAAGATWYLYPDLLAPKAEVGPVDVVKVDRPKTGVDVRVPIDKGAVIPKVDPKTTDPKTTDPKTTDPKTTDPKTTDPKTTDPKTTDPKTTDPKTTDPKTTDPKTTDPRTTDPKTTDPRTTDPRTTDPRTTDPKTTDPKTTDPVGNQDPVDLKDPKRIDESQVGQGEMLRVGGDDGARVSKKVDGLMERHLRSVVVEHNGLVMGSQALAQLTNENIFIGRVKALNSSLITLHTKQGEITLERTNLRALTRLDAAEYEELKDVMSSGLIRLRNSNRLKGKIVEARDDAVVLMVNANRVIIPKAHIESVTEESSQKVNFDQNEKVEDDDWFRELVERRIDEKDKHKEALKGQSAVPGK